jgi:hypothetical protein
MSKNNYIKSLLITCFTSLIYLIAGPGHGGTDSIKNIANTKVAQVSGNLIKSKKGNISKKQINKNLINKMNIESTIISFGGGVAGNYLVKV